MLNLPTRNFDYGPETVRTVGETPIGPAADPYHFYCPDVSAVDQYLATLGRYLCLAVHIPPRRVSAARRDIDRLLDRRLELMISVPVVRVGRGEYGYEHYRGWPTD